MKFKVGDKVKHKREIGIVCGASPWFVTVEIGGEYIKLTGSDVLNLELTEEEPKDALKQGDLKTGDKVMAWNNGEEKKEEIYAGKIGHKYAVFTNKDGYDKFKNNSDEDIDLLFYDNCEPLPKVPSEEEALECYSVIQNKCFNNCRDEDEFCHLSKRLQTIKAYIESK